MRLIQCLLIFVLTCFSTLLFSETSASKVVLHINADATTTTFIKNICLTTNNGLTKSCGNGAIRILSSYDKLWKVVPFNLYLPLGFDDSCVAYKHDSSLSEAGTLDLYTTLKLDTLNGVNIVSLTHCATAWSSGE